jgi:uncharacterized protein (TIGR00299 family) protein
VQDPREKDRMKLAYFDCIAGASGDMLLGALVDAGLPLEVLKEKLAGLNLPGFEIEARTVFKNGFRATKVNVIVQDTQTERHLAEIESLFNESALEPALRDRATAILLRIGQVEAGIHGQPVEAVHLHELGGLDTIIDVTGVLAGLDILEIERVFVSPLPLGRGFTRGAHGQIPLPAPATLALLEGVPVTGSDLEVELVTPTGAALLTSLAAGFGPVPAMTLSAIGYGAGGRDLPIPNLLRVLIGEAGTRDGLVLDFLEILETNIDDLNPEFYDHVLARLFEAGALDVTLSPIQMKKNRPATQLSVLCQPDLSGTMQEILFTQTSTLGIRRQRVERVSLPRSVTSVETGYGRVRVKIARWGDGKVKSSPEYEDCRRLAEERQVPLMSVYKAADLAAQELLR